MPTLAATRPRLLLAGQPQPAQCKTSDLATGAACEFERERDAA